MSKFAWFYQPSVIPDMTEMLDIADIIESNQMINFVEKARMAEKILNYLHFKLETDSICFGNSRSFGNYRCIMEMDIMNKMVSMSEMINC